LLKVKAKWLDKKRSFSNKARKSVKKVPSSDKTIDNPPMGGTFSTAPKTPISINPTYTKLNSAHLLKSKNKQNSI
jgi:hypothetical protein